MKKYELLLNDTITLNYKKLYRIKSLRDFSDVKIGDIGGYVESKFNLAHEGLCWIYDDAIVYDNARVYCNAIVCGNAKVANNTHVKYGKLYHDITDNKNLIKSIEVQCNLATINGEIYCYKQVNDDLSSYFDKDFKYVVGEYAEVKDYDDNLESCASGLHVSNLTYWNGQAYIGKYLFCKVKLGDVITVQEGKIRCKKLFVIGVCDNKMPNMENYQVICDITNT